MLYIAQNLRACDREEIFACRYGEEPEHLAVEATGSGAFRWAAYAPDGTPLAAVGAVPRWPGVWSAWAYGTDLWPKAAVTLTRHVRDFMIPALYKAGAHRVDCLSLGTHTEAHRWLEYLGAKQEFVLANYGKNGQPFVSYVWTRQTVSADKPTNWLLG